MGLIKYRGEVIYSGPLAEVEFDKNWCDSMAEYYPHMWYRDWETDRKSTRLNSSHSAKSRMPSSA